ncbi:dihydrolipoamide acetyltransferase family protein [Amnibacterium flavum]|uniref:Dihydrolipoamide acetyltransferase component of pyruvate dehydrogenase complex n=1 Tax=Amnibacterium flavum TaxID=2173173 RepID=A0A2V1HYC7_9MICO|nr:dihydrolipoamide acetyltransferase family protein [Amnibacterium flavum]PVZ95454.1 branched-chain alpha-keto acid dehydrogenase subunit E2 [Amnibacterium flavum]
MSTARFNLPDVGEGLTEAEIVSWRVQPGEVIEVNQVIVEIETAKSLVELPSPYAGIVGELLVAEGDTVEVGSPIITVDDQGGSHITGQLTTPAQAALPGEMHVEEPVLEGNDDAGGTVLVGYGTGGHASTRRTGRRTGGGAPARATEGTSVVAKPPVRRLAKELGVELSTVVPTGARGEATREDVLRHAQQVSVFRNIETPEWPGDREDRIPVKGVRKAIAAAMVSSAFSAPHVSVFVDVDATRSMEFVRRLKNSPDFAGVKVSPLLIMAKALMWAVRRNPTVNSSWTDSEIVVHHYVNLGIAAATPRGLIVPNIKDAQSQSLIELATSLENLTIRAREGKTQPAEMASGTITITNIGSFGVDTGTPILNPGEVAIVALGAIKQKPWVVDGEVVVRYVTTIGASFDHRVVDGDVASRFVADLAAVMEEPALLLD